MSLSYQVLEWGTQTSPASSLQPTTGGRAVQTLLLAYRRCSIVVAHSRHEAVTHWPPFQIKEPACQIPNDLCNIFGKLPKSNYCNWDTGYWAWLTRKSVLRQGVQTAGRHSWLVFSICWEASQSVLRLGRGLIPPAQRWVRLQRRHLVNGGAEEGSGKLRGRGWKARRIWGPEAHRCVWEIGGYSTLDWILVGGWGEGGYMALY